MLGYGILPAFQVQNLARVPSGVCGRDGYNRKTPLDITRDHNNCLIILVPGLIADVLLYARDVHVINLVKMGKTAKVIKLYLTHPK